MLFQSPWRALSSPAEPASVAAAVPAEELPPPHPDGAAAKARAGRSVERVLFVARPLLLRDSLGIPAGGPVNNGCRRVKKCKQ